MSRAITAMDCRRLAVAVLMDAIGDARYGTGRTRDNAMLFLRGEVGDVEMWVDCLVGIDRDAIMQALRSVNSMSGAVDARRHKAAARAKREMAARRRKLGTLPKKGGSVALKKIRYGSKKYTIQEAADLLGMPYSTLYNRWMANPGYHLDKLGLAGRDKYFLGGKDGAENVV